MERIKINLVTLGNLKHKVDFKEICAWQSSIFSTEHADQVKLIPNAGGEDWEYPDDQLLTLITPPDQHAFTVGVINAKLQDNYYIRRISNNAIILSLYETAEILHQANLTIENFIIRSLYEFCLVYLENNRKIPSSVYSVAHDETRSCLFDMNANKSDIVFSTENPLLCQDCETRLSKVQLPNNLLKTLGSELPKIQKALFFKVTDYVKTHPIKALCISSLFAIALNIIASLLYDLLKNFTFK